MVIDQCAIDGDGFEGFWLNVLFDGGVDGNKSCSFESFELFCNRGAFDMFLENADGDLAMFVLEVLIEFGSFWGAFFERVEFGLVQMMFDGNFDNAVWRHSGR